MHRKAGFTLMELIIVVALIGLLLSLAIPAFLNSRRQANESAAINQLRMIAVIQHEFRTKAMVDQDNDTFGEFGLLGELTGLVTIRTMSSKQIFISQVVGPKSNTNYGEKDGYYFQLFLPGALGTVTDNGHTNPLSVADNANPQENKFRCYAWPKEAGKSGNRVFVVDQSGNVYAASNTRTGAFIYSGTTSKPGYNAASPSGDTVQFGSDIRIGTSNDGQSWTGL